jgi:hypothetical protein
MKHMTKSACAAMGLTASILVVGCAGNAASRGSDEHATASQSAANTPTAAAASTSNAASQNASAAPAANAPTASAAAQGTGSSAQAGTQAGAQASPQASTQAGAQASTQAGAQASEKRGEFQGRIERLDRADNVTIAGSESVGLAFEEFKVDDKTQVTTPNGKGTVAQLNEGDEVRASFSGSGEDLHVDKLQVVAPKAAEGSSSR